MKTIEERKKQFKLDLWKSIGENTIVYSSEMLKEFTEYWCEISPRGKKMRFEKEKVFCFKRRMMTWKKHSMAWNTSPEKDDTLPNYFNKSFWQRITGDKVKQYKTHLFSLGWRYHTGPTGSYWQSPDNKMIWL
jgi:hypothetical protein